MWLNHYLYLMWLLSKVNYATMHKANCNFLSHCLAVSSALPQEYVSIPLDYMVLCYSKDQWWLKDMHYVHMETSHVLHINFLQSSSMSNHTSAYTVECTMVSYSLNK